MSDYFYPAYYLTGTGYSDDLYGGRGNDDIFGAGGDDYLEGNAGNDILDGGYDIQLVPDTKLGKILLCQLLTWTYPYRPIRKSSHTARWA